MWSYRRLLTNCYDAAVFVSPIAFGVLVAEAALQRQHLSPLVGGPCLAVAAWLTHKRIKRSSANAGNQS
jgi:hypothetical protein